MKIDGLIKSSERGFERRIFSVDDDKQRDVAGQPACWVGQLAKCWQDTLAIAVLSFSRNYSPE